LIIETILGTVPFERVFALFERRLVRRQFAKRAIRRQGHTRSAAQPSLPLIESEPSVLSVSFSAPRIVAICDIVPPSESDFVPAPLTSRRSSLTR
jgi:hypothetical protein